MYSLPLSLHIHSTVLDEMRPLEPRGRGLHMRALCLYYTARRVEPVTVSQSIVVHTQTTYTHAHTLTHSLTLPLSIALAYTAVADDCDARPHGAALVLPLRLRLRLPLLARSSPERADRTALSRFANLCPVAHIDVTVAFYLPLIDLDSTVVVRLGQACLVHRLPTAYR